MTDTFENNRRLNIIAWVCQVALLALLAHDVLTKLIGTPAVLYRFERIGLGGFAQFASALLSTAAALCMLSNRFAREGAILATLVMGVGVFFHLTETGTSTLGDGGLLFYITLLGLMLSVAVFLVRSRLSMALHK